MTTDSKTNKNHN